MKNKELFQKLEFDKILELLEKECLGEEGKIAIRNIKPHTQLFIIEQKLKEASELKLSLSKNDRFPLHEYESINKEMEMLEVVDYVLPVEGLQRLNKILLAIRDIFRFFTPTRQEVYPHLYAIIRTVSFDESLIDAIENIIDENGEIKPTASPELMRIHKSTLSKFRELDKQFKSIIGNYRNKGWLTDNVESFRNGRRVLSVPSEHKRKIRGIIHDESTTGKTAFIEPEAIISINNDIFDLETDRRREIYRLLKELSALLRPYLPLIGQYRDIIIRFDIIQSKARLAYRLKAEMPKIKDLPTLSIKKGIHPLLFLKNKNLNKETIPFDLTLFKDNRLLMLSGPNAGGKSITMKSLGLLQLMLQSGMLIPVDPQSEMGIFEQIYADIGDQQSIEDDLSTYSSRLENMRFFLENANDKTLLLIDEFGSGTDPKIGGAIAEAILRELNFKKVHGIITTHYSNLKVFAFKTKGIVNGSMLFDKDSLMPTYILKVGRPGSSYAFEIAQKSGLSDKVLAYAKHKTGKNEKAVDQLLIDLQREKQELEEKLSTISDKEKKLQKLINNYDQMNGELEYKRKKLKLEIKEQALQQAAQENKAFEKLIKQLREEKKLEKAKAMAQKARLEKQQVAVEVTDLRETIYYKQAAPTTQKTGAIKVGDFVKLKTGGATGKVESINKNNVILQMGSLHITAKLRDLQHANEPLDIQTTKGILMDTITTTAKFDTKLDLRGMRRDEALKMLEDFVDQAIISNAIGLKIIHGKGDGILRKAVKAKLREYKDVDSINHPEPEQGGDGVTLVDLK